MYTSFFSKIIESLAIFQLSCTHWKHEGVQIHDCFFFLSVVAAIASFVTFSTDVSLFVVVVVVGIGSVTGWLCDRCLSPLTNVFYHVSVNVCECSVSSFGFFVVYTSNRSHIFVVLFFWSFNDFLQHYFWFFLTFMDSYSSPIFYVFPVFEIDRI